MPTTYPIIRSLLKYHSVFGDSYREECPTGSGTFFNLFQVIFDLAERTSMLSGTGEDGVHTSMRRYNKFQGNRKRNKLLLFEYFNDDNSNENGAHYRPRWSGFVANGT